MITQKGHKRYPLTAAAALVFSLSSASAAFQVPAVPNPPGSNVYNPWMITLGVGTTHIIDNAEGALLPISDDQSDQLFNQNQVNHPSYMASVKRSIPMEGGVIESIDIGPALYYSFTSIKGEIAEFTDRQLNNFRDDIKSNHFSALAEADMVFSTGTNMHPFVTGGIGASWISVKYDDTVVEGGPADQEVHLDKNTNFDITFNVGCGAYFDISKQWKFGVRYFYEHTGKVKTGDNDIFAPMEFKANNHNAYLTLTWLGGSA